jgi:hypothetical protein
MSDFDINENCEIRKQILFRNHLRKVMNEYVSQGLPEALVQFRFSHYLPVLRFGQMQAPHPCRYIVPDCSYGL